MLFDPTCRVLEDIHRQVRLYGVKTLMEPVTKSPILVEERDLPPLTVVADEFRTWNRARCIERAL
jgi:hypothetical protein